MKLQRFRDFGKELKHAFAVHEVCYDCAEFYGPGHGERGCNGWPSKKPMYAAGRKHLLCLDCLRLPPVEPATHGQVFPPSRMEGRTEPRTAQAEAVQDRSTTRVSTPAPTSSEIDPKRRCLCGRAMPRRRRYCDTCRDQRKELAKHRYEQKKPDRSHHRGSDQSQTRHRSSEKAAILL